MFGIDSKQDRRQIQALRANPPGQAAHRGKRRRVFGAALGQWEALLEASGAVEPAAAPILLFYALSQAGRAVTAAWIPDQYWRSSGHGLRIGDPPAIIGDTQIIPDGGAGSSFRAFCQAIGSSHLTAATTLGSLWAANPQVQPAKDLGIGLPRAVPLDYGVGGHLAVWGRLRGHLAEALPEDPDEAAAQLTRRLGDYPEASANVVVQSTRPLRGSPYVPELEVGWATQDGAMRSLEIVAPRYGPGGGSYLRPAVNSGGDVLDPLPVWWAILLALSSIARYHPAEWHACLDRDSSTEAVPIMAALDTARDILPWLLLDALQNPPAVH